MRGVFLLVAALAMPTTVLAKPTAHHHRAHVHRRPAVRRLHLSGEISAASPLAQGLRTPAVTTVSRRDFAEERPALAIKNDVGAGTTASVGLQSRGPGPVVDPSDMTSAAQGMRQSSSATVGVKLSHPF